MGDRVDKLLKALKDSKLEATRLSDDDSPCVVHQFVSTGCTILDAIMGGGLPCGRIVEIYGDTSTGKSLIAAQACATIQEENGLAVYIDTETAVSLPIMEAVGVNTETLVYLAPDTVEEVFLAMEAVAEAKEPDIPLLIVWDSIAATSAKAELEKATGETGYLTHARVISQGLRKFTRIIAKTGAACLFLNQAKENIGVVFGDKVATFGGKAVGFHSSIRVMLKLAGKIAVGKKKSAKVIGVNARANVTKNKVAPPFRSAQLPIYFGHGIHDDEAIFLFLKDNDVLPYVGGYYNLSLAGRETPIKFRRADWPDVLDENWDAVYDLVIDTISQGDLL